MLNLIMVFVTKAFVSHISELFPDFKNEIKL